MSRVFITGDVHYPIDAYKLNSLNFPADDLTHDDYVIICGDAGFVWYGDSRDQDAIDWISSRPFTTLYIDGNHENHEALRLYPVVEILGAKAHKISDSLYHIMRGEILTINEKNYFCFGGAFSHDYMYRKEGESWWQDELPVQLEIDAAIDKLNSVNNKVDFIITHDVDELTYQALGYSDHTMNIYDTKYCDIRKFFNYIKENVEYDVWFAGHYHDTQYINNIQILYNEIIEILDDTVMWYKGRVHDIRDSHIEIEDIYKDVSLKDLYISLRYNCIDTFENFSKSRDTIYPLKDFLDVLESSQEKEAVIYLYKEYLIKLDK